MKYILSGIIFLVCIFLVLYYTIPLLRYVLIPLTGGTEEPAASTDIFQDQIWINSEPLRLGDLKKEGKFILIDFWTYTCINCIRANPHTQQLWERYKDYGLMIIGVHSPEFISIEADPENVRRAVQRAGYTYPIVIDSSHKIWNSFGNRFWPAKYLINPQGRIVYFHFGEGKYSEEEEKIRAELAKAGHKVPEFTQTRDFLTPVSKQITPELYAGLGFMRKPLGNIQRLQRDVPVAFELPTTLRSDTIYLEGSWIGRHDSCESTGRGSFVLNYLANAVYIVLSPVDKPVTIEVLIDGKPIDKMSQGSDIQEIDGKTVMTVDEPRLYYPLASTADYGRHKLHCITPAGIRLFSFTFGTY